MTNCIDKLEGLGLGVGWKYCKRTTFGFVFYLAFLVECGFR